MAVVVGAAVARRFGKSREDKKTANTAEVRRIVDEKVQPVAQEVTELKTGLLGGLTMFGHQEGFINEVRRELRAHGRALQTLVSEATPNGGDSMKDDIRSIKNHLEQDDPG